LSPGLLLLSASIAAAPPSGWHYDISVDPELRTLTTMVCFKGDAPSVLEPGTKLAMRFTTRAEAFAGEKRAAMQRADDGFVWPPDMRANGCAVLELAMAKAADNLGDMDLARYVGKDVLISPDLWLWQPDEIPDGAEVTASFKLAPGVRASLPWRSARQRRFEQNRYAIDRTTFDWQSVMALGRFEARDIVVKNATFHVAQLGDMSSRKRAMVMKWLQEAASAVTELYGEFPADQVQVLIDPVWTWREGGVEFGQVDRGGGPSVIFLVSSKASESELAGEWVGVHELSHLALPYVQRDDAWLSEGVATYYQNVLRARAGQSSEETGWQRLLEGFERGRHNQTGRSLRETSARLGQDADYMRVYWGGAAIAFLADVALRKESEKRSLDLGLRQLKRCCMSDGRRWAALDLLARMDEELGTHTAAAIASAHLERTEFPDLEPTLKELGVSKEGDDVRLDDRAPLAKIRSAIMRRAR
jgi:hypothetical protein